MRRFWGDFNWHFRIVFFSFILYVYLASETTRISFSVKAKSYLEASKKLFTIHITLVKKIDFGKQWANIICVISAPFMVPMILQSLWIISSCGAIDTHEHDYNSNLIIIINLRFAIVVIDISKFYILSSINREVEAVVYWNLYFHIWNTENLESVVNSHFIGNLF